MFVIKCFSNFLLIFLSNKIGNHLNNVPVSFDDLVQKEENSIELDAQDLDEMSIKFEPDPESPSNNTNQMTGQFRINIICDY